MLFIHLGYLIWHQKNAENTFLLYILAQSLSLWYVFSLIQVIQAFNLFVEYLLTFIKSRTTFKVLVSETLIQHSNLI